VLFAGASTDSTTMLRGGSITFSGNFVVGATGTPFAPSRSMTLYSDFSGGTATRTIEVGSASSYLPTLLFGGDGGPASNPDVPVTLTGASPVRVAGDLYVGGNVALQGTIPVTVAGQVTTLAGSHLGNLTRLTATANGEPPLIQGVGPATLELTGNVALSSSRSYTGALDLRGALTVGTRSLALGGDLRVDGAAGGLVMHDANGLVTVQGNALFRGRNTSGDLISGTLRLYGGFEQQDRTNTPGDEFQPSSAFRVEFLGSGVQTVKFSNPGRGESQSSFSRVFVGPTAQVSQSTAVAITDSLVVSGRWTSKSLLDATGVAVASGATLTTADRNTIGLLSLRGTMTNASGATATVDRLNRFTGATITNANTTLGSITARLCWNQPTLGMPIAGVACGTQSTALEPLTSVAPVIGSLAAPRTGVSRARPD